MTLQRVIQAQAQVSAARQAGVPQPRLHPFEAVALASRNARFLGVAPVITTMGTRIVAFAEVGVEGDEVLEALGRDADDATSRLATLANRPGGRS